MNKPAIEACWSSDRSIRWMPIERGDAARMLRGNRRLGLRVYLSNGQSHIEGHGVRFSIARKG